MIAKIYQFINLKENLFNYLVTIILKTIPKLNMLRKVAPPKITRWIINPNIAPLRLNPSLTSTLQQSSHYHFPHQSSQKYSFSTQRTPSRSRPLISQVALTMLIEQATNPQELRKIIQDYKQQLNFIHRTVFLQKATQRPFDKDEELVSSIIHQIKTHWKYDFMEPSEINSRAIANTICYMSRKAKFHDLDQQFAAIDFYELANHLTNPKEFVMMLNGLLKLQLLDKVVQSTPRFKLQEFLSENVTQKFSPSLIVSMWFNIIKYQKSTITINDFFANLVKNKNFKSNLIDYMQIIYCYVNSEGKRSVDLIYPVMTHPKELKDGKGYLGAHELSVMYEQLGKLKKIKDVYFSIEFNELLEGCFRKILIQKDIPLRNVANVFVNLTQWQNPTSKILDDVYYKYYTVLKNEITLLQSHQPNKRFKPNVDPLSFVTLFEQLLEYQHAQNTYLKQLTAISLEYVSKILEKKILSQYNEKTFVRLLSAIELSKKMMQKSHPQTNLQLKNETKQRFKEEISKRVFNEVVSLGKLIGFAYKMDIRQKQVCTKFKKMIHSVPEKNQFHASYQAKLKQSCVLDENCPNCSKCFSN